MIWLQYNVSVGKSLSSHSTMGNLWSVNRNKFMGEGSYPYQMGLSQNFTVLFYSRNIWFHKSSGLTKVEERERERENELPWLIFHIWWICKKITFFSEYISHPHEKMIDLCKLRSNILWMIYYSNWNLRIKKNSIKIPAIGYKLTNPQKKTQRIILQNNSMYRTWLQWWLNIYKVTLSSCFHDYAVFT